MTEKMKSYKIHKTEAELKNQKKENVQDTISKSVLNVRRDRACNQVTLSAERQALNIFSMSTIRNHVQLIGNIGQEPTITNLESGKKLAKFSLATNEFFKNSKGEKSQETQWHNIIAQGKTADIIEKYAGKGKEVGVSGKLKSRSYEDNDGIKRYVTEVEAEEILLLGTKDSATSAD